MFWRNRGNGLSHRRISRRRSHSRKGNIFEFNIVGQLEADPAHGKLSEVSPIGSALLGKKVGDKVEVEIPDGKIAYTVLEIN